jgi:K+/H+ antiporter YhaU regulatory subunit KhtT
MQDLVPEAPVIARVNEHSNVEKIHRAGADFALSVSQVSGQMLARRLLGEEALTLDARLKVVKLPAAALAGRMLADLGLRERTGASVLAVERGGELLVDLDRELRFAPGDAAILFGSETALRDAAGALGSSRDATAIHHVALEAARDLLGVRLDEAPPAVRSATVPGWARHALLEAWGGAGEDTPQGARLEMSAVRTPAELWRAVRMRWPNPLEATVYVGAPLTGLARWPIQLADCVLRAVRFAGLP